MASNRTRFRTAHLGWIALLAVAALTTAGLALLCPPPAQAQMVEVKPGTSGRTLITNENRVQRARRLAPRLVSPPSTTLSSTIEHHARRVNLDPRLVQAVVQVESGYNPRALSNKGAQGLMQLMPGTARDLGVARPFDPHENIRGGTDYLRQLVDQFRGNLEHALAAYNAGPGAVSRYRGIPPYPETRDYVRKVLGLWRGEAGTNLTLPTGDLAPAVPVEIKTGRERLLLTNDPDR